LLKVVDPSRHWFCLGLIWRSAIIYWFYQGLLFFESQTLDLVKFVLGCLFQAPIRPFANQYLEVNNQCNRSENQSLGAKTNKTSVGHLSRELRILPPAFSSLFLIERNKEISTGSSRLFLIKHKPGWNKKLRQQQSRYGESIT